MRTRAPCRLRACASGRRPGRLGMTFTLTQWHAGRFVGPAKPRWSPRCAVCGDTLGRDVTLDVMDESGGGRFRLTCQRRDPAHAAGVSRHYELSADHSPGRTIEHVALKSWAE